MKTRRQKSLGRLSSKGQEEREHLCVQVHYVFEGPEFFIYAFNRSFLSNFPKREIKVQNEFFLHI